MARFGGDPPPSSWAEAFRLEGSNFPAAQYCMSRKRARHKNKTGKPFQTTLPLASVEVPSGAVPAKAASPGQQRKVTWPVAVGIVFVLVIVAGLGAAWRRNGGQNRREVSRETPAGAPR